MTLNDLTDEILDLMPDQEELKALMMKFRSATEAQDWPQVLELDRELREVVASITEAASSVEEKRRAISVLQRLAKIIGLVQSGAEKHRGEIKAELTQLTKEQKAVASYSASLRF